MTDQHLRHIMRIAIEKLTPYLDAVAKNVDQQHLPTKIENDFLSWIVN